MNATPNLLRLGLLVLFATGGFVGCGSGISGNSSGATLQTLGPVDEQVAKKAQTSCWFKVANRSSDRPLNQRRSTAAQVTLTRPINPVLASGCRLSSAP